MLILTLCGLSAPEVRPLTADDLLLIYNDADVNSRTLARHYAEVRGVPQDRLCPLVIMRAGEEVVPADFERMIREPVRRYIEEHALREKVRCLVTFYGLPIRVARSSVSPARQQLLARWRPEFDTAIREFDQLVRDLEPLAKVATRPAGAKPPTENDLPALMSRYLKAREAAINAIAPLPAVPANEETRRKWLEIMQKAEGVAFIAASLELVVKQSSDPAASRQLAETRQSVNQDDMQAKRLLAEGIESPKRDEARLLVRRSHGLVSLLNLLQNDVHSVRPEETEASVDSELALLWWPDYPRSRWVANTLNWQQRAEAERQVVNFEPPWIWQTLMVSRIDAGSAVVARRMIDQAITIEKTALTGKAYIDARGIKLDMSYGLYDEDLRKLARILQDTRRLGVVLDNQPALFQPGQCPQAILYCGWYSLRKYVPAFTFVSGAVGFHIGSFEAASLKGKGETGWCKRLLDDGVIATVGPVAEPYLTSFPPPSRFFGLLVTGRYTLAECYAYTLPFHSWMQMLLGDPLYRPFAKKPLLRVEQVYESREIPRAFQASLAGQPTTGSRSGP